MEGVVQNNTLVRVTLRWDEGWSASIGIPCLSLKWDTPIEVAGVVGPYSSFAATNKTKNFVCTPGIPRSNMFTLLNMILMSWSVISSLVYTPLVALLLKKKAKLDYRHVTSQKKTVTLRQSKYEPKSTSLIKEVFKSQHFRIWCHTLLSWENVNKWRVFFGQGEDEGLGNI